MAGHTQRLHGRGGPAPQAPGPARRGVPERDGAVPWAARLREVARRTGGGCASVCIKERTLRTAQAAAAPTAQRTRLRCSQAAPRPVWRPYQSTPSVAHSCAREERFLLGDPLQSASQAHARGAVDATTPCGETARRPCTIGGEAHGSRWIGHGARRGSCAGGDAKSLAATARASLRRYLAAAAGPAPAPARLAALLS